MCDVDVEMSVGVGVVVDVVVDLVVRKGKETHGGQTPPYSRKPALRAMALSR